MNRLDRFQEYGYLIEFIDCQDAIKLCGEEERK